MRSCAASLWAVLSWSELLVGRGLIVNCTENYCQGPEGNAAPPAGGPLRLAQPGSPDEEKGNAMTTELSHPSWTREARDVLERACDQHGGIAAWRRLRLIRLFPDRLSGLVPWLKGNGRTFPLPSAFEILPHQRSARFLNYPDDEHVGIFENGAVRLERADGTGASP